MLLGLLMAVNISLRKRRVIFSRRTRAPCFLFTRKVCNAVPLFVECVGGFFRSACVAPLCWMNHVAAMHTLYTLLISRRINAGEHTLLTGAPTAECKRTRSPFYLTRWIFAGHGSVRVLAVYLLGCVWRGPSCRSSRLFGRPGRDGRVPFLHLAFLFFLSAPPARLFTWRAMSDESALLSGQCTRSDLLVSFSNKPARYASEPFFVIHFK